MASIDPKTRKRLIEQWLPRVRDLERNRRPIFRLMVGILLTPLILAILLVANQVFIMKDIDAFQSTLSSILIGLSGRPDTKFTELSFSVFVDENKAKHSKKEVFAYIDKVVYVFDDKWFRPAARERTRPSDGFLLKIKVWGSTKVIVEIHLDSPRTVLTQQGYMNLSETIYFKNG